jgi:hypothetical protein
MTDNRGAAIDYSGTYTENGTFTSGGITSVAYERADSGAWIWRDWASFANGYWVVSLAKGDSPSAGAVTQVQTGNTDPCPETFAIWDTPLGYDGGEPYGDCVAGSC